jgi:protein-tyrosine kinase
MEKIQAAIAKARATREGLADAPLVPVVNPVTAAAPQADAGTDVSDAAVTAAWAALPSFLPDRARLQEHHVVTLSGGAGAASFDGMRTRVLQQMRTNNWRRLAITSPGPASGKSTIALNLAFGLARQASLKVILLEVDLRRPSLAKMIDLWPEAGFARVLDGTAAFETVARRYGDNLAIAVNIGPVTASAELLGNPMVADVLDAIEARYAPDIVICDMPPMLGIDDTLSFLPRTDCALLVAAAETTRLNEIDICEREIAAHTSVMGTVLNKCRYMDADYGYGASY